MAKKTPKRKPKPNSPTARNKSTGKSARSRKAITEPSRPTVKRLFALSGNRCAFPGCPSPLVEPKSGSIIGQICHIKGEKKDAARYDKKQSATARQGFANLILMCGPHHKVIDDNPKDYPAPKIVAMKKQHESGKKKAPQPLSDAQVAEMIASIPHNRTVNRTSIHSQHQSGGQTAQTIHNYHAPQTPEDEEISVVGTLSGGGNLKLIEQIGCPGLEFNVVCRSRRPAKIRKAFLCAEGRGFVAAMEAGFGANLDHDPPEGHETETLVVELLPLSTRNSPEGFVLNRDDVCRFYLPLSIPNIGTFLTLPASQISLRVEFFDKTERTLLAGEEVQVTLQGMMGAHSDCDYHLKVPLQIYLRCSSKTLPRTGRLVGTTNPNHVSFVDAALQRPHGTARGQKIDVGVGIVASPLTHEHTIGLQLLHAGDESINQLTVAFVPQGTPELLFIPGATGVFPPGAARTFTLPFHSIPELLRVVGALLPAQFAVVIRTNTTELFRLPGEDVRGIVAYRDRVAREEAKSA